MGNKYMEESIRTIIAHINITLVENFYNFLIPFVLKKNYMENSKKNNQKTIKENLVNNLEEGSIITLIDPSGNLYGTNLKKSKGKKDNKTKPFGNATTIVIVVDKKLINFKVFSNGKMQFTGCKSFEHAEKSVIYFYKYIKNLDIYKFNDGKEKFVIYIKSAMCAIRFKLNFMINREKLGKYIKSNYPGYPSLWENSLGSAGVNIKMPLTNNNLQVKKIECLDIKNNKYKRTTITDEEYQEIFPVKKKKIEKKYTTFLVFHGGKVNMTSIDHNENMKNHFDKFIEIINSCREIIEEKNIK